MKNTITETERNFLITSSLKKIAKEI